MFEGFGTTFVYVVVRRFVFDFGVSFVMDLQLGAPHLSFVCC
jgi:hypothetical protein